MIGACAASNVLSMFGVQPDLADQPDRRRWNARYSGGFAATFAAHPLAVAALGLSLPDGPVLDLASGPSGSVLLAAAAGRRAVAVDASDVALDLLRREAGRRQVGRLVGEVHADLTVWRPEPASYALVLCTGYWDRALFGDAARAVLPGGLIGWEAFTADALRVRPGMPAQWCLGDGEPASLLPAGYQVLSERVLPDARAGTRRRLLARRASHQHDVG
jgi:SAM-dependent methyltransferase